MTAEEEIERLEEKADLLKAQCSRQQSHIAMLHSLLEAVVEEAGGEVRISDQHFLQSPRHGMVLETYRDESRRQTCVRLHKDTPMDPMVAERIHRI